MVFVRIDLRLLHHARVSPCHRVGRQAVHLVQITVALNAGGGIAVKPAPRLPDAIAALFVDLALQQLAELLLFNGDGLGVQHAVHAVRLERRAEGDVRVFAAERLARQRKRVPDARERHRQHAALAAHGAVHGKGRSVQAGQLFGKLRHIRAALIAPLQHQRQQGLGRGPLPGGGPDEVDGNAAAVEFFRRKHVDVRARRKGNAFHLIRPFCSNIRRSGGGVFRAGPPAPVCVIPSGPDTPPGTRPGP